MALLYGPSLVGAVALGPGTPLIFDIPQYAFTVVGTGTGALQFGEIGLEGSLDGTNWVSIAGSGQFSLPSSPFYFVGNGGNPYPPSFIMVRATVAEFVLGPQPPPPYAKASITAWICAGGVVIRTTGA